MLDFSLCSDQTGSPTRLWTLLSSTLLITLSRPLIVATLVVGIISLFWLFGKKRWNKPIAGIGIALLATYLIVISPVVTHFGTQLLLKSLPADSGDQADAIVVLGRGEQQNSTRAKIAGSLWQTKRAPLIFPSGRKDALIMANLLQAEFPNAVVEGEPCSLTTEQNAEFTAAILRPQGIKKIILVTDPLHMRRSLLTFKSFGFEVIPHISPLAEATNPIKKRFLVFREGIGLVSYALMGRYSPRPVPPSSVIYQNKQATI